MSAWDMKANAEKRADLYKKNETILANETLSDEDKKELDKNNAEIRSIDDRNKLQEQHSGLAVKSQSDETARNLADDSRKDSAHLGLTTKEKRSYSLFRAIKLAAANKPIDGLEGELSQEIAKRCGKAPRSFYMPMEIEQRDLDTTTGAGAIDTTVLYSSFVELLRKKAMIQQIGARVMSGLVGEIDIPKQTGGATAYWVAPGSDLTESNQTIEQVQLRPNTIGAYTEVTRRFLNQVAMDAEAFVRDDLAKVMALGLDYAAIAGDGTGGHNSPTGILNTDDVGVVAATANHLTWANVVAMETAVATANADVGKMAYLTNVKVRGDLKTTLRSSVAGAKYIWDDNNTINGYPAFASNQVPTVDSTAGESGCMIFGNFEDLIIGLWGAVDVLVDPFSLSKSGGVRIVAFQDSDIQLRHPESFCICTDIHAG